MKDINLNQWIPMKTNIDNILRKKTIRTADIDKLDEITEELQDYVDYLRAEIIVLKGN